MERQTIGEVRKAADPQRRLYFSRVETKVRAATHGRGINHIVVKKHGTLGGGPNVIGTFHKHTKEESISDRALEDEQTAVQVIVHEIVHHQGTDCSGEGECHMEGFARIGMRDALPGQKPIDIYDKQEAAARHLIQVIGPEAKRIASRGVESQALLVKAYVLETLAANDDVEVVVQEAWRRVALAA